jgi:hypothetical protein
VRSVVRSVRLQPDGVVEKKDGVVGKKDGVVEEAGRYPCFAGDSTSG